MCHDKTNYLIMPNMPQEQISQHSFNTLWATVVYFKKTTKTKQIFESMQMIQENYQHYINIYNPYVGFYRNDFALTFATRLTNGQLEDKNNYLPWALTHVSKEVTIKANSTDTYNTSYTLSFDNQTRYKVKKEYMVIENIDFHMMNKENFMELV